MSGGRICGCFCLLSLCGLIPQIGSRAFASRGTTPDENFAREIMQLFSIGLYMLHNNGTLQVDSASQAISTYDNINIMNFARVWTGFKRRAQRGNIMRGKVSGATCR